MSSSFSPLPWCRNRLRFLVTNGVKTHLHYVVCCSNLCILSNRQVLGSKFGFVLFSFLKHCPPALAPAMVWLLFSLFFPFCLTKSWLIEVCQVKFVSWKIYKKLPLFRCQPSDDIMWACLPSSCRMSGWWEVVAVKLSLAFFPVHLCGLAWWLSFKINPLFLLLWG